MKILAIETSCEHGSVALLDGDHLHVRRIDGAANHSATVLHEISGLLAAAGWRCGDLDAVAFGAGPGAFTGLRLACGVAQGIALGSGIGVAVVGSHQALALQAAAARVFVATDARMGELYHSAWKNTAGGEAEALRAPQCCSADEVELPEGDWFALGSAFRVWPQLRERFGARLLGCDSERVPRADEVARLATGQVRRGELLPAERAAPLYVRDKVAYTTAERLARGGRA